MIYLLLACFDVFIAVLNYHCGNVKIASMLLALSLFLFYTSIEEMVVRIMTTGA